MTIINKLFQFLCKIPSQLKNHYNIIASIIAIFISGLVIFFGIWSDCQYHEKENASRAKTVSNNEAVKMFMTNFESSLDTMITDIENIKMSSDSMINLINKTIRNNKKRK